MLKLKIVLVREKKCFLGSQWPLQCPKNERKYQRRPTILGALLEAPPSAFIKPSVIQSQVEKLYNVETDTVI